MSSRVAYLITAYKLPQQTIRLASVLRAGDPEAQIVVHHDNRRCEADRTGLDALGVQFVQPASAAEWGEFSQLAMVLRCMRWVLAHSDFGWLVLLSGQDYPVRPVVEIKQSLAGTEVDALIEVARCERPAFRRTIDEFASRYHYRWRRLPAHVALTGQIGAKARPFVTSRSMGDRMWLGVPALRSPFGPQFVCHHGLDWFTLSRRAVDAVDRFTRMRPEVVNFYRHTLIPTESFVHTVLANDTSLRLSSDHGRYVVFDADHRSRPRILGTQDLESVLASGAHFARKFDDTVDREVLDEIDRRVHARPSPS